MTCEAIYKPGYGSTAAVPCLRIDVDDQGRHRGQHHGWEDMPAGTRQVSAPDPDRPGWSIWADEPYPPWRRLWTWDAGGAQGSSSRQGAEPTPCPECGTPSYPESSVPTEAIHYTGAPDAYAVAGDPNPQACYHCRLWASRIAEFTAGWVTPPKARGLPRRRTRLIRLRRASGPDDRLNSWAEGSSGAYGDRKVTVRWDDGDQRGPASSMWSAGLIPWWLDGAFPTNAVLVDSTTRPDG
jgi:hypothetical protein